MFSHVHTGMRGGVVRRTFHVRLPVVGSFCASMSPMRSLITNPAGSPLGLRGSDTSHSMSDDRLYSTTFPAICTLFGTGFLVTLSHTLRRCKLNMIVSTPRPQMALRIISYMGRIRLDSIFEMILNAIWGRG